ncbi:hypothetical protein SAMN05216241_11916 [Limimonas halophila]|uniref:Uncharacterized protein n=1 Tax=Limimonas halophila TaxID=1082479 RepID=A0A1G7V0H1_9PROT|nr:hypothetical protein [Limimonas halophila]SDG53365.1 hypothetical protein SAMN05216241_11916 [Limimonas halophila]
MDQNLLKQMLGRRGERGGQRARRADNGSGDQRLDAVVQAVREIQQQLAGLGAAPDAMPDVARRPGEDGMDPAMNGGMNRGRIPSRPEDYPIEPPHPMVQPDPEVNRALHGEGFTDRQAQLVYDLAAERMLPAIEGMAREFEADRQQERLIEQFGGEDAWREVADQLATWGRSHLPREVFEALSTTFEGVMTMHRMMTSGEPGMTRQGGDGAQGESEDELRRLMADPRYWRDRDPATVKRVQQGFQRLFPQQG